MSTGTETSIPAVSAEGRSAGRRAVAVAPPPARAAEVPRVRVLEVFDMEVLVRVVVPPRPERPAADVLVLLAVVVLFVPPPEVLLLALLLVAVRLVVVLPAAVLPRDVLAPAPPPPEALAAEVLLPAEVLRGAVFSLVARPASAIPAHPPSRARTRCPVKSRLFP
ncbi:hypothetical protein OG417_15095 [Actinoallomurus sp. NBC_01490]|uniref:hypothetical protein n=1 Tax=Actinoallomurus sp. NBC_01490 TaxID=2903557 RepID=UPI002E2FDB00|nr:hypothetical protein [Actinoallomurus sp. NBC_01490]